MQATDIRIDPAVPADAPLILSLIRELAEYEQLAEQVVATEADLRSCLFGRNPAASAVVARIADQAVGFALYFRTFSTFLGKPGLYLEDLYVRPAFRGRSVGKRLLSHLAAHALAQGCARFEWAVLDWNAPARRFYESLGAQANSSWIPYRVTGEALQRLAEAEFTPSPPAY
jgi:GNAT superfamily N-acetyltransferase